MEWHDAGSAGISCKRARLRGGEHGIAEVFEAFVIFIGIIANGTVGECGLIQTSFAGAKTEYISQVFFVRNAALISNKSVQDSHKYKLQ